MYRKPNQKLLEAGWKEKKLGGSGRDPIIIKVLGQDLVRTKQGQKYPKEQQIKV